MGRGSVVGHPTKFKMVVNTAVLNDDDCQLYDERCFEINIFLTIIPHLGCNFEVWYFYMLLVF